MESSRVVITSDTKNGEFHQSKNCKDILIMKELEKLKEAFERYKQTVSFKYLWQKIYNYEEITNMVYYQAVIESEKESFSIRRSIRNK